MTQATHPKPLVSIITICKNSGEVLKQTIQSVLNQSYEPVEYLIIDGASTDNTQEILKNFTDQTDLIISEPDRGISHAFNKGIEKATGSIIGLLNASDIYLPDSVAMAVEALEDSRFDFCFGDCLFHESDDYSFLMKGEADYLERIHYRMPVFNHPTVFVKRETYLECGMFDESWKIAMDYELLRRFVERGKQGIYIPKLMAEMDRSGLSISNMPDSIREVTNISMLYGLPPYIAYYHYGWSMLRYWLGKMINSVFGKRTMKIYRKMFIKRYVEVK